MTQTRERLDGAVVWFDSLGATLLHDMEPYVRSDKGIENGRALDESEDVNEQYLSAVEGDTGKLARSFPPLMVEIEPQPDDVVGDVRGPREVADNLLPCRQRLSRPYIQIGCADA